MTIKCTRNQRSFDNGSVDFGFVDQKGRKVGYKWQILSIVMIELTDEEAKGRGYYTLDATAPREYFEVWSQPTRDGNGYGAAFNRINAVDLTDARKIVTKRIAQACKRDAKKFEKEEVA